MYTIYLIVCAPSGKCYVGQTRTSIADRLIRHKVDSRRSQAKSHLYHAIRKYGESAFTIHSLIEGVPSKEEADRLEIACIEKFHTRDSRLGYNISVGGDQPLNHKGMKRSEDSKLRYRESKLGAKNPRFGQHHNKGTFKSGTTNPNQEPPTLITVALILLK